MKMRTLTLAKDMKEKLPNKAGQTEKENKRPQDNNLSSDSTGFATCGSHTLIACVLSVCHVVNNAHCQQLLGSILYLVICGGISHCHKDGGAIHHTPTSPHSVTSCPTLQDLSRHPQAGENPKLRT